MRALALLFAFMAMFAAAQGTVIAGCGFGNLDFSALANQDLYYSGGGWTYVLRMCGTVTDYICGQDTTTIHSSLCQRTNSTNDNSWNLMSYTANAGTWGSEGAGFTYQLVTGEQCNSVNTALRSTTVHLMCSAAATTPYIVNVVESSQCQYHVYLYTSLACSSNSATCTYLGVNLSPIFTTDLAINTTGTTPYTWYLNMCSRVQNSACQADTTATNAMVCQRRVGSGSDAGDAYAIANYNASAISWSIVTTGANAGLLATVQNGEFCNAINAYRTARVKLVCDASLTTSASYISGVSEVSTCVYEMTVFTPLTCSVVASSTGYNPLASTSSWWPTATSCVFTSEDGLRRSYDFTALQSAADLNWSGFMGNTFYNVYFHMCGVVRNSQCLNDSTTYNSMVCQAGVTNTHDNYAMSTFIPSQMIWAEYAYGVQFYQETGEFCGSTRRNIVVQFECNSDYSRAQIISVTEIYTCQYIMLVRTSLTCNGTNQPVPDAANTPIYKDCVVTFGNKDYDFKLLNPASTDLSITVNGSTVYNIYLSLCRKVENINCRLDQTATNSMVCQQQVLSNGIGNSYSLADYIETNMIWGPVGTEQKIRLNMINGELCGSSSRSVQIDFICDSRYPSPTILSFVEPTTAQCQYLMTVAANVVMCNYDPLNPDGSSSSDHMSGGMIALIVLVILLGLILIIFACIVWRYFGTPYAFQKESKHVEMHGEPQSTNQSYEHEESTTNV